MEAILDRVKGLKDTELRERLKNNGVNLGPITPSTRLLFQKKLAKIIFAQDFPDQTDDGGLTNYSTTKESNQLKSEPTATSTNNQLTPSMFYGVCLPAEDETYGGELVFIDKMAALNLVKKYKDSRFKVFRNRKDAEDFTKLVAAKNKSQIDCQDGASGVEMTATGIAVEKSAFKGPKTSELVTLRRVIERGDKELFIKTVWDNPRYLISSADTPVILQEGLRYNALHIAAISNKPVMCKVILNIISDPEFTQKLYCFSTESEETKQRRIDFVFDLYLNMPDKGHGESPLHFACKFGFPDVVRVLLEYPGVDRHKFNKHEETPSKVNCRRCNTPTPELKSKIEELLQGLCYVPLLRSQDNTTAPMIGQPWSPDNIVEPHELLTRNPTDPQLTIRAYAGPMSPSRAQLFHRQWTTSPSSSPNKMAPQTNIRREDGEKGLERIGRQLAQEMQIAWSEYWEFLDSFVDFSTTIGIRVLENYLLKQQVCILYRQWVKAHSNQINTMCLDSSIMSEYSEVASFTEDDSIVSVDSDVSPVRNDLFRHNKIDRGVIKDFNNSDNEISEVFTKECPERTLNSVNTSDMGHDTEKNIEPFNQELKSSYVLQPARLKYGIDAPDTACLNPASSNSLTKLHDFTSDVNMQRFEATKILEQHNLTDEIKLSTPSREPCQYDFKYSSKTEQCPTVNSACEVVSCGDSVQTSNIDDNSGTPPWRDGRIKSGDSEDSVQETFETPSNNFECTPTNVGAKNFDDSVLLGFQKLQLGSSDEDSFQSALSDVFATPNNLEISFNSQLTNLCDDLKQKLTFTPRNHLSRTVSVVSSLSENQEAMILKTKYSNLNFEILKILSNFKSTGENPVPVLLVIKDQESHDLDIVLSECDILTDCVIFDVNCETESRCISQVRINLVVSVSTQEQKDKLLSSQSCMILSLCLYKDNMPNCVELSVPALMTKLETKEPYFILGQRASKLDQDVFRALVIEEKEMNYFPLTESWRKTITNLQTENQQSWPSPARIRREGRLSGDFAMMSPLVAGRQLSTPSFNRYSSPFQGQQTSLSPSVFQFTPKTSRLTSSPRAPRFNLEKHLEEGIQDE